MFMPTMFRDNLFDNFFDDAFQPADFSRNNLMKTDIRETDDSYELEMDVPGVNKEDIKAELKDGYLTVSATANKNNDEKDDKGNYIRRERYAGSFSRSFYVGENITENDIKAKFENGTLKLSIPKKEEKKLEDNSKYIAIEG